MNVKNKKPKVWQIRKLGYTRHTYDMSRKLTNLAYNIQTISYFKIHFGVN